MYQFQTMPFIFKPVTKAMFFITVKGFIDANKILHLKHGSMPITLPYESDYTDRLKEKSVKETVYIKNLCTLI